MTHSHADKAGGALPEMDATKALANAKARAALLGVMLIESATDTGQPEYIVAQCAWVRAFTTLPELLAWLDRREGRA